MKYLKLIIIVLCVSQVGCAGIYSGFTQVRIKAKEMKGRFGMLNYVEGKDVDASLVRDMRLTGSSKVKIEPHPTIKSTKKGEDTAYEVMQNE